MLAEGLAVCGLTRASLDLMPGRDARKVGQAEKIWAKTTMKMDWLAKELAMKVR